MVLIMAPAIDGLKKEWREASENMGATTFQYWRHVALPILMPTLLGTMILLFGNAFGAQATAFQLTGGADQHRDDPDHRASSAVTFSTTSISATPSRWGWSSILGVTIVVYLWLQRRARAVAAMRLTRDRLGGRLHHRLPVLLPAAAGDVRVLARSSAGARSARHRALKYYGSVLTSEGFWESLGYSFLIGIVTIIVSIALLMPTAFWVRLRVPRAATVRRVHHAAAVRHPADRARLRAPPDIQRRPPSRLPPRDMGSNVLLMRGYVILSFPYMYRAVDTGLQAIDVRTLTEAAQSLGAGWPRILVQVILPNLRVALLSGAFLTFAIVIGEFTIASFLARPAFGPYLSLLGARTRPTSRRRWRSSASASPGWPWA